MCPVCRRYAMELDAVHALWSLFETNWTETTQNFLRISEREYYPKSMIEFQEYTGDEEKMRLAV